MRQILSVQMLRALAALMVVVGHVQAQAIYDAARFGGSFTPSHILPWGAGVDLFFVISGFIMVVSSEKLFAAPHAPVTFITRRLARIIPLYWAFSTLYLLTKASFGAAGANPFPTWPDIIASYAFWPADTFGDGFPRPFYTLGWTLNYEMFFYALFAVFLVFPRGKAVSFVAAVLAVGVALGLLFHVLFRAFGFLVAADRSRIRARHGDRAFISKRRDAERAGPALPFRGSLPCIVLRSHGCGASKRRMDHAQ